VPPAENSVWARERRDLPEVDEPKQLVDLVRDDEFPLSLFYAQLKPKLGNALERSPDAAPQTVGVAGAGRRLRGLRGVAIP
jgi:hypothetical protein